MFHPAYSETFKTMCKFNGESLVSHCFYLSTFSPYFIFGIVIAVDADAFVAVANADTILRNVAGSTYGCRFIGMQVFF